MLEGLEISEVKYATLNKDIRFEPEFFLKKYSHLKNVLSCCESIPLSNLVKENIKTGHTPSMKNDSYYGGYIRFIKTDNLRENRIIEPFSHYLSVSGNEAISRTQLEEGDIITTIIGATYDVIARSCILRKENLPANINQNIALIRADNYKINTNYLCTYLNSIYGRMYLEYLSRQTEQVNLNCQEVGQVLVPQFSVEFQKRISNFVTSAYEKLSMSVTIYDDASKCLLEYLQIQEITDNNIPYNEKLHSFTQKCGRIDAEYYQPKYDNIVEIVSQCQLGQDKIGKMYHLRDGNFVPNDDTQYKYIELSNIGVNGEITGCTYGLGVNLPSRARRIVHTGDIIVSSIEGSLQSCAIIPKEYDGALCSTGFYVLTPQTINAETSISIIQI